MDELWQYRQLITLAEMGRKVEDEAMEGKAQPSNLEQGIP